MQVTNPNPHAVTLTGLSADLVGATLPDGFDVHSITFTRVGDGGMEVPGDGTAMA